ncbi:nitrogenase component 1 [Paenibacillus riograndensis]|uniref:Nitrogenase MoFe cofactor biosynthesis protein NifE n=1 Tax=Paenibacillus riograndensis SBR5 TaxID=1073571 RepID=A0A0E4HA93_9BACL|nr:nitrogenase component 1 [Paenibacillus riograndensis]CQR55102.1 nitrogenase MoFe cofactor biosynthesis protein NifE [Paenibacillus riograndensis SBR5]
MPKGVPNLFIEPDCEHNRQPGKGCARPNPGEVTKGCVFQGSQAVLLPISDAAHLVHGTSGCLQNSWGMLEAAMPEGPLPYLRFSMGLTETDIILGGQKKLLEAIQYIIEYYHPPCIFVYATCITILTAEDLNAVCSKAESLWKLPVIPLHNSGFTGSGNMGSRQAGEALFEKVIGTCEPDPRKLTPFDINLIGDYHFSKAGHEIEAMLSKIGIRVISRIAGECTFDELCSAHQAKLNLLVCSRSMVTLARKMRDSFGIPYFEGSFCGSREIRFALRQLSFHFQNEGLDKQLNRYMRREEERLHKDILRRYKPLKGKKVVLFTDGHESWIYISLLYELGIKIAAIGTNQNAQEDLSRIKERIHDDTLLIIQSDETRILQLYRERKGDLMIVSGRNSFVPLKEKIPFINIGEEQHGGYAGYDGVRRFAQDVMDTLAQPVWTMIRRHSPWEVDSYG